MIVLRWQLRKWFKQINIKVKILLASVLGHLLVLFSLFIFYRGNENYHILITGSMINTDVPIVFLPMHKSLKKSGGTSVGSARSTSHSEKIEPVKVATTIKKQTVAISLPDVKSKKNKKLKKEKAAKADALKKQKASKKEILKQASADAKAKVDKQNERKIELEKPKPLVPETAVETSNTIQSHAPQTIQNSDLPASEDVLYVGQQEMDALQMQDYIQKEMAQHWSPPVGMRNDISCEVKIMVACDGTIQKLEIDQSSGVMLFDDAAKRAAWKLTPPQWAYGKELTLTFKP